MVDGLYDEFLYYWISAVVGKTPRGQLVNADFNADGYVSMDEAFRYARTNDTRSETPQYSSTPSTYGQNLTLNGYRSPLYNIIGPDKICRGVNATFSIANLPSGATVQWTSSNGLTPITGSGNSFTCAYPETATTLGVKDINARIVLNGSVINVSKSLEVTNEKTFPHITAIRRVANECWMQVTGLSDECTNLRWEVIEGYGGTRTQNGFEIHVSLSPLTGSRVKMQLDYTDQCGKRKTYQQYVGVYI